MNKTLLLLTASFTALGISGSFSASAQAREVDCINYWRNPETKLIQCFDNQLNFMAVPVNFLTNTNTSNINSGSPDAVLRRRATGSQEMVMPDLIGLEIDAAEDYLLGLGVSLGSEEVYAQNKVSGEIIQQTPQPGTELTKGQTVLLKYMGATINPLQVN